MASTLYNGLELATNFNSDVLDKSGNGRHGTVNGMTYDIITPMIDSGNGVFDGLNDDVEIDVAASPQSDILDLTVGTIALWVRDILEGQRPIIFSITHAGFAFPAGDEWAITIDGRVGKKYVQAYCYNGGSLQMSAVTPINSFTTGSTKQLIVVKAKASGNIEIFIDDALQTPLGSSPLGATFFGDAVDADTMRIGSVERDTIVYTGVKDVDALAIWNRDLTTAEGTEYWNGGSGVELEVTVGAPSMLPLLGVG